MVIDCADCGHVVSIQAVACPNCGRPMSAQTIEQTGKTVKLWRMVGNLAITAGVGLVFIPGMVSQSDRVTHAMLAGMLLACCGFLVAVCARIESWWHHE